MGVDSTVGDRGEGCVRVWLGAVALLGVVGHGGLAPPKAEACGCFVPPEPPPQSEKEYAVNQQSEQIVFEVRDGKTSAHILIRYEGNPEEFAWLLPVPTPPELNLSETELFTLINEATFPEISVIEQSHCPQAEYVCQTGTGGFTGSSGGCGGFGASASAPFEPTLPSVDASLPVEGPPLPPSGVEVLDRQVIGSYDTITFMADDGALALAWLQDEGFIVNETTLPFIEPCLEAGMVMVAVRLVPEADTSAIQPLEVTYDSPTPMIPLKITAVAAEPELAVTSYIFADSPHIPFNRPLVTIPQGRLSVDDRGRINYPMALSRVIDEAGGDGFVVEYVGAPPPPSLSNCCDFEELGAALETFERLSTEYAFVTRLTTRLSPHEMTFDPTFIPVSAIPGATGRLRLVGTRNHVDECRADARDPMLLEAIESRHQCATTYCGEGRCAITDSGAGCRCAPGFVARQFLDMDGQSSITCVPEEPIVDYAAGGVELKDPCTDVDCGLGECIDIGGFPACRCSTAGTAILGRDRTPRCVPTRRLTSSPGAEDFTADVADLAVCWPVPPDTCPSDGWLIRTPGTLVRGVSCEHNQPDPALLEPPASTSERSGCGVAEASAGFANLFTALAGLLLARVFRRRQRRRRDGAS
jgi:hypothetical protein